jgi:hypothetical protein
MHHHWDWRSERKRGWRDRQGKGARARSKSQKIGNSGFKIKVIRAIALHHLLGGHPYYPSLNFQQIAQSIPVLTTSKIYREALEIKLLLTECL